MDQPSHKYSRNHLSLLATVCVLAAAGIVAIVLWGQDESGNGDVATHGQVFSDPWADPELRKLEFDIVVNNRWRIRALRVVAPDGGGEIELMKPFDVSFEPTGLLAEQREEWSLSWYRDGVRDEVVWGETVSIGEDTQLGKLLPLTHQHNTDVVLTDFPRISAFELGDKYGGIRPIGQPRWLAESTDDSTDGTIYMQEVTDPKLGLSVELSEWTAYENADGERTGFDATFTFLHPTMDPQCQIGGLSSELGGFSHLITTTLSAGRHDSDFSPNFDDCPSFDSPGYVKRLAERQWWADWTRGEEETTLKVSMRFLPLTQELTLARVQRLAEMEIGWKLNLGRDMPVVGLHASFEVNCGDESYDLDGYFMVPLPEIKIMEAPPPGAVLSKPE